MAQSTTMPTPQLAERNLRIQSWVNFLAGATFLVPVITLFYKHTGLDLFQIVFIANVATFGIWLLEIPTSVFADTLGRKRSLQASVVCNLLGACVIALFPHFYGFIVASVFSALYWSFWSGTGQAFLAENLTLLKRDREFGRVIGSFMFYEQLAALGAPFITSAVLFLLGDVGFRVVAVVDVVFAAALVVLVFRLHDFNAIGKKHGSFAELLQENVVTAKQAFANIIHNGRLRLLLLYRSLANHVAYLPLIILPLLSSKGMPDWFSGVITALAAMGTMVSSKYAYKIGERHGYRKAWVIGTVMQAFLLIAAGFLVDWWMPLVVIFLLFNVGEGLWQPSWNHVLVEETSGTAIATTRSMIFSAFALYTTIGKQLLSLFPISYALIGMGVFILLVNTLLGRQMLAQGKK